MTQPFTPSGPVVHSTLPAGRVARTVHRGSNDRLDDPHRAVRQWCAARAWVQLAVGRDGTFGAEELRIVELLPGAISRIWDDLRRSR